MELLKCFCNTLRYNLHTPEPVQWRTLGTGQEARIQEVE